MKFIFDENFSHRLAQGLSLIEQGNLKSKTQTEVTHDWKELLMKKS